VFLLEGTHLLEEACAVDYPLVTVFSNSEWHSLHQQLWQQAFDEAERAEIVSPEVFEGDRYYGNRMVWWRRQTEL